VTTKFLYKFIKDYFLPETIADMLKTFDKDLRETTRANISLLIKFLMSEHRFEENKEYTDDEVTKIIDDIYEKYHNQKYTIDNFETFLERYSNYRLIEFIHDFGGSAKRNKNANIQELRKLLLKEKFIKINEECTRVQLRKRFANLWYRINYGGGGVGGISGRDVGKKEEVH
jgi:hypothetical protein